MLEDIVPFTNSFSHSEMDMILKSLNCMMSLVNYVLCASSFIF